MLKGFFQNGYVVDDMDQAIATLEKQLGITGFVLLEPKVEAQTLEGFGLVHVKVALAWVGKLQVELIQPVDGYVRHYREMHGAEHPIRHHHVGLRVEDWDATMKMVEASGLPIVYQGDFGGVRFVYLDARETIGHYIEYLWATPEGWRMLGWPKGYQLA